MRISTINTGLLALICGVVVEIIYAITYYLLGSTYGSGTFTNIWCGSFLWIHWPIIKKRIK
jgi:hypothetical protein